MLIDPKVRQYQALERRERILCALIAASPPLNIPEAHALANRACEMANVIETYEFPLPRQET